MFMNLTVADNLKIGGHTDAALALFPELKKLLGRRAGLLSGGQQQMLTLGRALAMKPKMLLIDELSVGLAPIVVDRLFDAVIAEAHESGMAVLLVEQQARRALRVADRWYLLRRGVLAAEGTPATAPSCGKATPRRPLRGAPRQRMIPVGQQRADRGDQRDGLVHHHVVRRRRDLDDRGDPAEPVVHDLAHLRGHQAVLGAEQRDPAVQPGEQCQGRAGAGRRCAGRTSSSSRRARRGSRWRPRARRCRQHRLVRDGTEPGDGRFPGRVDPERPERTLSRAARSSGVMSRTGESTATTPSAGPRTGPPRAAPRSRPCCAP